jgi:hypothetical protein
VIADARQDERNKLAAIVNHGADTLARVLVRQLAYERDDERQLFDRWLADYLLRRLHVSQWVLDRWGGPAPSEIGSILGPEHLRAAIAQHERIFAVVADDLQLRMQLHWNNGTLAARGETPRAASLGLSAEGVVAETGSTPGTAAFRLLALDENPGARRHDGFHHALLAKPSAEDGVIRVWIDWPEDYRLTVPADGLFGYLLGEALINAVKHGAPGVPIELEVDLDRSRRELVLTLRNHLLEPQTSAEGKAYGGLAIIVELARLCGWTLTHEVDADAFVLRWSCPMTLQPDPGQID